MYILFDIGATNMRIGASNDGLTVDKHSTVPTPSDFDAGMTALSQIARELVGSQSIQSVIGGIPGSLDPSKTTLLYSPHLPAWTNQPIKNHIQAKLDAPVYLENDAALEGLGEATEGAGKGHRIVAYITVGTGIGGVRIVDGRIDANSGGFEPGHQIIDQGHTLEFYTSGTGLQKQYGATLSQLSQPQVDEWTLRLAYGLNNIIVCWSPDIIVLGGGVVMNSHNFSLVALKDQIKKTWVIKRQVPPVVVAALTEQNGFKGALKYLSQQISQ